MKNTFKNALLAQVKDYGLSDKAINELVEQGSAAIADDAAEEMVKAQVNLFANIAKTMQSEVTRKVQAATKSQSTEQANPSQKDDSKKDGDNVKQPQGQNHENVLLIANILQKYYPPKNKRKKCSAAANCYFCRM